MIFWLIFIALIIFTVSSWIKNNKHPNKEDLMSKLAEKYIKGELSKEEFEHKKEDIKKL